MYGAVIHAPGDVRYEEREDPTILEPTDAIVRTVAACVCGSDLWRYRGISPVPKPTPIGHEYCGVVEAVGDAVTSVKVGDFVVGGFNPGDNTCPVCRKGAQANCQHGTHYAGCQADRIRIPFADGTLLATPGMPAEDLIPSILALSDVMCTGWHAAVSADVGPGKSVAVVGDGAVGLCAALAAVQLPATNLSPAPAGRRGWRRHSRTNGVFCRPSVGSPDAVDQPVRPDSGRPERVREGWT